MRHPERAALAATALEPVRGRFKGHTAIIFATGPSLPKLWQKGRKPPCPAIAVNDAWKLVPAADILYATDVRWWRHHQAVPEFEGVKVGWGGMTVCSGDIVWLAPSGPSGFDPRLGYIRHCSNSGGAAVHLAAQLGSSPILLVGFDQRRVHDKEHFFGDHPAEIADRHGSPYGQWQKSFEELAGELAKRGIAVFNCTPDSALKAFPTADLETML